MLYIPPMPSFRHGDVTIHYEEFGQGFPILTFAPAGLQSTIEVWSRPAAPITPITELAASFRVIAMDQRNAGGRSHAPITARDAELRGHPGMEDRRGPDRRESAGPGVSVGAHAPGVARTRR